MSEVIKKKIDLKTLLDERVGLYNRESFIAKDPISVPHQYILRQDIEIAGFFAAIFAWGNRRTIINKTNEFLSFMDNAPFAFVRHFTESDLPPFLAFKHRTFNPSDALFYLHFFKDFYQQHDTLEDLFIFDSKKGNIEQGLNRLYQEISSHPYFQKRNGKHVSSPMNKSRCKRLNMYLRWMVRKDDKGVDFGLWDRISPAELFCPLDVHVEKVARKIGLLTRKQSDWKSVIELTENLKKLDPQDPVKYDFALFGLSTEEKLV